MTVRHIGFNSAVGAEIAKRNEFFVTERLGFEVVPGQFCIGVEREARLGDPENQLFGITEVRTVADVPYKSLLTGAHRGGRPISSNIVRSRVPGLSVETTYVLGTLNDFAALMVSNHAHEVVPMRILATGSSVVSESVVTLAAGRIIRIDFLTTVLLT